MPWNNFLTMAPPGAGRTHGAPPSHSGLTAHGHHGHPGGPPVTTGAAHPVTVAQQHREREEREALERERERDAREREQREREREREHLAAAERLHRVEARDHVAAQRAAYYATSAPPAQQVRCFCVNASDTSYNRCF